MNKIFLSYSHRCAHIARQLYFDLCRAGCTPWIDEKDIKLNEPWASNIDEAIERSDLFILLWSPEVECSTETQRELNLAIEKHGHGAIRVLRVGGPPNKMSVEIQNRQFVDLTLGYWDCLDDFINREKWVSIANAPKKFDEALSFKEIRTQLGNDRGGSWNLNVSLPNGANRKWELIAVPWLPSGYAMSWRIGDANSTTMLTDDLFVVLKFTASPQRSAVQETISFLRKNFDFADQPPQLLYIEGPRNQDGDYYIPDDQPHQWLDCVNLCHKSIDMTGHSGRLHFFLDAPQALTFPIASKLGCIKPFVVYNLDRQSGGLGHYRAVYDSTGALTNAKPSS